MEKQNSQNEGIPSNILAKDIISSLYSENNNNDYNLNELLELLKNKKNPCHQKFSAYIQKQLGSVNFSLQYLINVLMVLQAGTIKVINSSPQINSITTGFKRYFIKFIENQQIQAKRKKQFVFEMIKQYFCFVGHFCKLISELIYSTSRTMCKQVQQNIQNKAFDQINQHVRARQLSSEMSLQCCSLIHYLDLYCKFKIANLSYICQNANQNDIAFFFKTKNGIFLKQVFNAYVAKKVHTDQKRAEKIISNLSLNHLQFPSLMKNLHKKCLRYLLQNQAIYSVDLIVKGRPQIIKCLIELLIDQNRQKQALHFINKYHISQFYHLNPGENRSYSKNILQKCDQFLPTEMILAKAVPASKYSSQKKDYLTIESLGFNQSNVIFVNKENINSKMLDNIMSSPEFGMDCESSPVFSGYEKRVTSTMQIAIRYKSINLEEESENKIKFVYILDIIDLADCQLFKSWFVSLCSHYKGKIIGHTVGTDFYNLIKQINVKVQEKNVEKLNFIDVAKIFKQKNNETKSSLEYMCRCLMKKDLSKFQQCSGWQNRPLRNAQLHYAALDAVLPLRMSKLLKQNK